MQTSASKQQQQTAQQQQWENDISNEVYAVKRMKLSVNQIAKMSSRELATAVHSHRLKEALEDHKKESDSKHDLPPTTIVEEQSTTTTTTRANPPLMFPHPTKIEHVFQMRCLPPIEQASLRPRVTFEEKKHYISPAPSKESVVIVSVSPSSSVVTNGSPMVTNQPVNKQPLLSATFRHEVVTKEIQDFLLSFRADMETRTRLQHLRDKCDWLLACEKCPDEVVQTMLQKSFDNATSEIRQTLLKISQHVVKAREWLTMLEIDNLCISDNPVITNSISESIKQLQLVIFESEKMHLISDHKVM